MPTHDQCAAGGRSKSTAKLAALQALHKRRRGLRMNRPGLNTRELGMLLADLAAATRDCWTGPALGKGADRRSIRAAAAYCRVDDRTMRRWMSGTDWPPSTATQKIKEWLGKISNRR